MIHTFCALMRGGGLNAASNRLGVSPATISRRIRKLETLVEDTLFSRSAVGYRPTEAAEELYESVRAMDLAATQLQQSVRALSGISPNVVRISAGNWLSRLIAQEAGMLMKKLSHIQIEILNSYSTASLSDDEADIALRNQRPERGQYICKRYPTKPYAVFCSQHFLREHPNSYDESCWPSLSWVGFVDHLGYLPSTSWVLQHIGRTPDVRCSQAVNILDALIGSAGLGIIPCFVGRSSSTLIQLSETVTLDIEGIWAITHEKVHKRPAVQSVLTELSTLLSRPL